MGPRYACLTALSARTSPLPECIATERTEKVPRNCFRAGRQHHPGCRRARTVGQPYWPVAAPALQGCVHHPLVHESADLALPCVRAEGVGGESVADLLRFSGYDLPGLALPAGRDDRLHGRDGSGPERLEYIGVPLKPRLEQKRVLTERPRGAKASLSGTGLPTGRARALRVAKSCGLHDHLLFLAIDPVLESPAADFEQHPTLVQ